jgi:hypothetical protein
MSAEAERPLINAGSQGLGGRSTVIKYLPLAIYLAFSLVMPGALYAYIAGFFEDRALSFRGVTSLGTVLAKEYRRGRTARDHKLTYTFVALDGAKVNGRCHVREGSDEERTEQGARSLFPAAARGRASDVSRRPHPFGFSARAAWAARAVREGSSGETLLSCLAVCSRHKAPTSMAGVNASRPPSRAGLRIAIAGVRSHVLS